MKVSRLLRHALNMPDTLPGETGFSVLRLPLHSPLHSALPFTISTDALAIVARLLIADVLTL